jgi:mono/diheme cytochrome c family protein
MGGDTHQTPQVGKSFNPNFNEGDFVFSLLGREQIEQSVDSMVREREKLEQDRLNLEEKRKRVAARQLLNEEKRKLEEEKQRLKEEQEKFARLMPRDNPSAKSGGKCPQPRKTKSAPGGISKKDKTGKANLANGKKIYLKTAKPMACKICHGKKGDGGGKLGKALKPRPRNFTCAATMKKVSAGQMFYIIKNGSKGTGMVAHKKTLKDKEIWDVVKYIRESWVK